MLCILDVSQLSASPAGVMTQATPCIAVTPEGSVIHYSIAAEGPNSSRNGLVAAHSDILLF